MLELFCVSSKKEPLLQYNSDGRQSLCRTIFPHQMTPCLSRLSINQTKLHVYGLHAVLFTRIAINVVCSLNNQGTTSTHLEFLLSLLLLSHRYRQN